ncbi:hypothetical protein [Undibacterium sp. Ren11W]|uniref:hypothetical protein n=1 Tax=Undibacterium sp. Ren11W TaxID=3413045 RepID=UPI003BF38831
MRPYKRVASGGLRQRSWWVMRRRIVFTVPELLSIVTDGTETNSSSNLAKYVNCLMRYGVLHVDAKLAAVGTQGGRKSYRYRLVINNGPKAPVYRTISKELYDPNTDTVFALVKPSEDGDE